MQAQLYCATCNAPLAFAVPALTDDCWHLGCAACGAATALEANLSEPGELATFNAAGVHVVP